MGQIFQIIEKLLPFLPVTIAIAAASMFFGLLFGGLLAAMKISGNGILKKTAEFYTTVIRCTPVIILLFLSYYGVPVLFQMVGIDISRGSKILFAVLALTLYSSAVLSEIIRPAYLAVNKGQYEAAVMVGLSPVQAVCFVVLPQAFYIALPNLGNMMIALVQQSSLAFLIGVVDLMGQAKVINSITYSAHIIEVYAAVSLIYWVVVLLVGKFVDYLTYKMGRVLG